MVPTENAIPIGALDAAEAGRWCTLNLLLVSRLISSMTTTASLWYHESCLASLCRRFAFDPKIDVS